MKKIYLVISITLMTGCNSHVQSDWNCPLMNSPYGCIGLSEVDKIALDKLETDGVVRKGKVQKIWLAPSIDENGYLNDASVIYMDY